MAGPLSAQEAAALGLDDDEPAPTVQVMGEKAGPRPVSGEQAMALGLEDGPPTGTSDNLSDQAEAGVRHAAQGLTSNFMDEIGGFFQAVNAQGPNQRWSLGPAYRHFRDKWRGRDDALAKQYPATAATAGVGGAVAQAFVPGVGAVTRIPGVGGAIAGLGASDAELTTGDAGEFGRAALHTGAGAGVDLLTAGAGKYAVKPLAQAAVRSAPARVVKRAVDDLLLQVRPRQVLDPSLAKLGGRAEIPKALEQEGIDVMSPAPVIKQALDANKHQVGAAVGGYYDRVTRRDPGVPLDDWIVPMEKLAKEMHAKGKTSAETSIRSEIARVRALYQDDGALNANQLHGMLQEYGEKGWEGAKFLAPKQAARTSRDLATTTRTVLQDHIGDVAKRAPDVGSLDELQKLNERYTRLQALGAILDDKVKAQQRPAKPLHKRLGEAVNVGALAAGGIGAAGAFAAGEGEIGGALLAAGAGARALPHLANATDKAMIRIAQAARQGGAKVELMRLATNLGIPREIASQLIDDEQTARTMEQQVGAP
jgi:hypothetical protein